MDRLIASGLFGRGLIHVDNKHMVDRYNQCLEDMGLPTTKLTDFRIDGMGWSPEVADEREDPFYLTYGGIANPFAIILSPKQRNRPVFFPFHSFDRHMMEVVFKTAAHQISDITTQSAIWIDIDQDLTTYRAPQDLLMVDSIQLRFHTYDGLMATAKAQRKLVQDFNDNRNAWSNESLLQMIIDSAEKNGDLRYRSLVIPTIPYGHVRSFFTRAFGGLFVIRDTKSEKPILIHVDQQTSISGETQHSSLEFNIDDESIWQTLLKEELIATDLAFFQNDQGHFDRLMDFMAIEALDEGQTIDWGREDQRRRMYLDAQRSGKLPEVFFDLERISKMVKKGKSMNLNLDNLGILKAVAHPNPRLDKSAQEAIWVLLTFIGSTDVKWLFGHNKERFYNVYHTWPDFMKKWSVDYLKENYVSSLLV